MPNRSPCFENHTLRLILEVANSVVEDTRLGEPRLGLRFWYSCDAADGGELHLVISECVTPSRLAMVRVPENFSANSRYSLHLVSH